MAYWAFWRVGRVKDTHRRVFRSWAQMTSARDQRKREQIAEEKLIRGFVQSIAARGMELAKKVDILPLGLKKGLDHYLCNRRPWAIWSSVVKL
jgi:hypothetical protein